METMSSSKEAPRMEQQYLRNLAVLGERVAPAARLHESVGTTFERSTEYSYCIPCLKSAVLQWAGTTFAISTTV
jgi:hypothetical protein